MFGQQTVEQLAVLRQAKRVVVKVGSSLVTNDGKGIDEQAIAHWARQLAALVGQGREVIMVSSGAVAEGMKRLGWRKRPSQVHELQAAAAVGQMGLVQMYESKLSAFNVGSAQVLLTHADLADRERYLNARSTLTTLLELGVVPVINENDTVVNDEIKFGDNDTLGALVANLVVADALIILTDQAGLYTADPRRDPTATFVHSAPAGDARLEAMAGGAGSLIGKGGMITKLMAAKVATDAGCAMAITLGSPLHPLKALEEGAAATWFTAHGDPQAARKRWIAAMKPRGEVQVDDGAIKALKDGKSLLPAGIRAITGSFGRGDPVAIVSTTGARLGLGLTRYTAAEARQIMGRRSADIEALLGYKGRAALIHRDDMVI